MTRGGRLLPEAPAADSRRHSRSSPAPLTPRHFLLDIAVVSPAANRNPQDSANRETAVSSGCRKPGGAARGRSRTRSMSFFSLLTEESPMTRNRILSPPRTVGRALTGIWTLMVVTIALVLTTPTRAQIPAVVTQFDMTGFIQQATVDNPS